MSSDRRKFLQMAGLAPAAVATGVAAASTAPARAAETSLTCAAFERLVGESFTFEKEVFGEVGAKLAAVTADPACKTAADREGRFSLRFEASAAIPQGSYRVHHAALGDFVLFVSPKDREARQVEAVFNRL